MWLYFIAPSLFVFLLMLYVKRTILWPNKICIFLWQKAILSFVFLIIFYFLCRKFLIRMNQRWTMNTQNNVWTCVSIMWVWLWKIRKLPLRNQCIFRYADRHPHTPGKIFCPTASFWFCDGCEMTRYHRNFVCCQCPYGFWWVYQTVECIAYFKK